MENLSFIPTAEKVTVENYPYGYSSRTTLFDTIEFDPKKGYRHVTQTINPKNGRLNAPKKSTYYNFMLRYKNEIGHIKTICLSLNRELSKMNDLASSLAKYWEVLTENEKTYLLNKYKEMLSVGYIGATVYGGSDETVVATEVRKLKDYINSFANYEEKKVKGKYQDVIVSYNLDANIFLDMPQIDVEAIKNATPDNYQAFTSVSHTIG